MYRLYYSTTNCFHMEEFSKLDSAIIIANIKVKEGYLKYGDIHIVNESNEFVYESKQEKEGVN